MRDIIAAVLDEYRLPLDGIHGRWHWLRVRHNGLALATATPDADLEVIEHFALLHDSQRWDDGYDRDHGTRAAAFVERLAAAGIVSLERSRLDLLVRACAGHTLDRRAQDPTIACCFDADRLDLSRLLYEPEPAYMSTTAWADAALRRQAWAQGSGDWRDEETARVLGLAS